MHGFLAPGLRGLTVVPPHGRAFAPAFDPRTRSFLALLRSTGATGESARLIALGGDPRRRSMTVALGGREMAQSFAYTPRNHGRTIRVGWLGGPTPFVGVDARRGPGTLTLDVLELYPPDFAPDGTPNGVAAIGIVKCANVKLSRRLLSGTSVIDGATGRPARRANLPLRPAGACPTVRPGQRLRAKPL